MKGRFLWLAVLALAHANALEAQNARAPDQPPPYLSRGRQTEALQQTYHDRIERFYQDTRDTLRVAAGDLLAALAAPPREVHGYQIVPTMAPDAVPFSPGTAASVATYSWPELDASIQREMAVIDRLDAARAQLARDAPHAKYEQLVADYRDVVKRRKPIDSNIQYNWYWQARIDDGRPIAAATRSVAPPDFVRFEEPAAGLRLITVPLYTDIIDAEFIEAFRNSVEHQWQARVGDEDVRVRLSIETVSPEQLYCGQIPVPGTAAPCAPPGRGDALDLEAHVARFPKGVAVLTTGAPTLQWVGTSAIVLGPQDVTPHVLAHEFGHVLGFPDTYGRGSRDLGSDGYQITEQADLDDIMGAPGVGPVLSRHFEELLAANFLNVSYRRYSASDFQGSIDAARAVLKLKPGYAEAYNNIAAGLASLHRWDEAITAAEEALRLKPDFPLARNNLAWAADEKEKARLFPSRDR